MTCLVNIISFLFMYHHYHDTMMLCFSSYLFKNKSHFFHLCCCLCGIPVRLRNKLSIKNNIFSGTTTKNQTNSSLTLYREFSFKSQKSAIKYFPNKTVKNPHSRQIQTFSKLSKPSVHTHLLTTNNFNPFSSLEIVHTENANQLYIHKWIMCY